MPLAASEAGAAAKCRLHILNKPQKSKKSRLESSNERQNLITAAFELDFQLTEV